MMVRGVETVLGDAASAEELFLTSHVQTWYAQITTFMFLLRVFVRSVLSDVCV
jgi:hypothetical protein